MIPSQYSTGMKHIANELLLKDMNTRMNMTTMLNHPLLAPRVAQFPQSYRPKAIEERIRRGHARQLTSQIESLNDSSSRKESLRSQLVRTFFAFFLLLFFNIISMTYLLIILSIPTFTSLFSTLPHSTLLYFTLLSHLLLSFIFLWTSGYIDSNWWRGWFANTVHLLIFFHKGRIIKRAWWLHKRKRKRQNTVRTYNTHSGCAYLFFAFFASLMWRC